MSHADPVLRQNEAAFQQDLDATITSAHRAKVSKGSATAARGLASFESDDLRLTQLKIRLASK